MRSLLIVALLAAALPARGEILRWTGADGRVHYGDRASAPSSGAEVRPELGAGIANVDAGSAGLDAPEIEEVRQRARARTAALEDAYAAVSVASAALESARAARARGVEPLPGERLGMAGGGSRLGPGYFERQARLAAAVDEAQARLDSAIAARKRVR